VIEIFNRIGERSYACFQSSSPVELSMAEGFITVWLTLAAKDEAALVGI
jgi:hypothetical protein